MYSQFSEGTMSKNVHRVQKKKPFKDVAAMFAPLQPKMSEALRWRATSPGDFEGTSLCQQVYRGRFLN